MIRLDMLLVTPLGLVAPREPGAPPLAPSSDRVVALDLDQADPTLAGRGAFERVEHTSDFSGALRVWAISEDGLDLFLRAEDAAGRPLAENDNGGGGTIPFLELTVEPGRRFAIVVAAATDGGLGSLELHFAATPETEATREGEELGREFLGEILRLKAGGDLDGARHDVSALIEELLALPGAGESALMDPVLFELGHAANDLNAFPAARRAWDAVHRFRASKLPPDHFDLFAARVNFGSVLRVMGEQSKAHELAELSVRVAARTLPEEDRDLQTARTHLANSLLDLGDLHGARQLYERVLEVGLRTLSDGDLDLATWRRNLGVVLNELGDRPAARELFEQALTAASRSLPDDHIDLQRARINFAGILSDLDLDLEALALKQKVVEVLSRTLPEDNLELQAARQNLAGELVKLGDMQGARPLAQQVVDSLARTLPQEHPRLQHARQELAGTLHWLGDLDAARALLESISAISSRTLPDDHPDLQRTRRMLAWTLAAQGDRAGCSRVASEIARALRGAGPRWAATLAPRELEARALDAEGQIATVLSLARGADLLDPDPALEREAFAALEGLRGASLLAADLQRRAAGDAESAQLLAQVRERSAELSRLARTGAERDDFARARREHDLALRRLADHAARSAGGDPLVEPDAASLGARLGPQEAIASWWRCTSWTRNPSKVTEVRTTTRMWAFVVRPGGGLTVHDLGPIEPIEQAVARWRKTLVGRREDAPGRGVGLQPAADGRLSDAGKDVRRLVLDPLLDALDGVRTLIASPDDILHAVPLDVLPESGALLGERLRVETHVTLRGLLAPRLPAGASDHLVVLGGLDYDERPDARVPAQAQSQGHAVARVVRSGAWNAGFAPLPGSLAEASGIAETWAGRGASPCDLITQGRGTLQTLIELAPRARYLHLATHGWFAPESVASTADPAPVDARSGLGRAMTFQEQVRGSSPMLLCGLALAGANQPPDERGRLPGAVTAEELAGLDLSSCELAVLSACDTNDGIRRAGQGVASLQKALHMAGARSVITSLWKVPDEATRELMLDFYRRLWVEAKTKHQALWEAKMSIRDAREESGAPRYTTGDWAAWVLTGEPD